MSRRSIIHFLLILLGMFLSPFLLAAENTLTPQENNTNTGSSRGSSDSFSPPNQPFVPRVEFGQRLEPVGKIISGAGQSFLASEKSNNGGYKTFAEAMEEGYQPALCSEYIHMNCESIEKSMQGIAREVKKFPYYLIPQIGLSLTSSGEVKGANFEDRVASGEYDPQIAEFCRGLKELDRPVFLRIGYEFNGPWNGYKPDLYKKAFVRIAQEIRKAELNDVALVWCCSKGGKVEPYYPGDEWVDWFGIDIWVEKDFGADSSYLSNFLNLAKTHRKPVIISETTPRMMDTMDGEKVMKNWFHPFFDMIRREPTIKAFVYINRNWAPTRWPKWGDGRIEKNPLVQKWVQAEMKQPFYIHRFSTRESFLETLKPVH